MAHSTKLKGACPCCGWTSITIVVIVGKHNDYYIRCNHCGFTTPKSRMKWRAIRLWNKFSKNAPKKKYHMYGKEF